MIKSCPRCGETILITPDRCLKCGRKFTREEKIFPRPVLDFFQRQKTRLEGTRPYWTWIIVVLAVSAVLLALAFALPGMSLNRPTGTAPPTISVTTPAVTTTRTPETSAPIDPVIGTWQWTLYDQSKTIFYTFGPDGQYSTSDSKNQGREYGTWAKAGENQYKVIVGGTKEILYDYQPGTGTIAKHDAPDILIYPKGKEPGTNASSPNQTIAAAD